MNSEAWNELVWSKNKKDWEFVFFFQIKISTFFALNVKKLNLPYKGSHNSYKWVGTSQNLPQVSQQGFSKKKSRENIAQIFATRIGKNYKMFYTFFRHKTWQSIKNTLKIF